MLTWQVYERAIANTPPAPEKRYWQRYIYLWINYALFEELEAQDMDRTREVYRACLKLIPHKAFTFAKVNHIPCQQSHSSMLFLTCTITEHACPDRHYRTDATLLQTVSVLWEKPVSVGHVLQAR